MLRYTHTDSLIEEYSQSALDQFSHEKEKFFLPLQRPFGECCVKIRILFIVIITQNTQRIYLEKVQTSKC
jgi:hypothetical protein